MTTQEIFDLAIHTIETVQRITKLGGTTAETALKATEAVVDTFLAARASSTHGAVPVNAAADITKLHDELAANDAVVDALIGDRR